MSVRSELLKLFEARRGEYISGESIALSLGVSRAAVWKAVKSLKEEGYPIDGVPNRGYRLSAASDLLSEEAVRLTLRHQIPLTVYGETDSTLKRCSILALEGAGNGTAVIADSQTAGRGRLGRSFYSPPGKGLYLSMVLRADFDMSRSVLITVAACAAAAQAIEAVTGITPDIKWVNDLYLNGKKICGILCEALTDFESGQITAVIPGIGINCRPQEFPEELRGKAGWIPASFSRNELAAELIDRMLEITENIEDRSFMDYYRAHSMVVGKEISVRKINQEPFPARALAVDNDGGLVIRHGDGREETLTTGEVSIRIK